MKKRKSNPKDNGCWGCDELICLGEGDHICSVNNTLVLDEYIPTDNFEWCKTERGDKQ